MVYSFAQELYGSGTPILRIDDYRTFWSRASQELRLVDAQLADIRKYGLNCGRLGAHYRVNGSQAI